MKLPQLRETLTQVKRRDVAANTAQLDRLTRIEESQADVGFLLDVVERVADWLEFTEPSPTHDNWDEGYQAAMETVRAALDQAQKDAAQS